MIQAAEPQPGAETPERHVARERLLEAAEKLFAEQGYAATRVQEITDAAQVNKAMLYYYFEDKRALYVAIIEDGLAEFEAVLEAALGAPVSYADRLRLLIREHVALIWRRPDRLRVFQRSQMEGDLAEMALQGRCQEPAYRLERFFAEATAAGEFGPIDPLLATLSLFNLTAGLATHLNRLGKEVPPEEVAEHVTQVLLHGLQREAAGVK